MTSCSKMKEKKKVIKTKLFIKFVIFAAYPCHKGGIVGENLKGRGKKTTGH